MSNLNLPDNYLLFNTLQSKNIVVVVEIPGLDLLSNRDIFTRIRYGDPGLFYGEPLPGTSQVPVYGGLRKADGQRDLLMLDGSSLVISQKLEPEQGRGSISTLTLSFLDKDQYMTRACSPGIIIDDILGKKCKIWLGYKQISFPEDYFVIFRGRVSDFNSNCGKIQLQFSDPNITTKQSVFSDGTTVLAANLAPTDTTVPVLDNGDFYQHILGPSGVYDVANPWNPDGSHSVLAPKITGINTYLKIGDEYLEYGPLGFGNNVFTGVLRGARGTIAADHTIGDDVTPSIQFTDNAVDVALKLMLSGWDGPWMSNVPIVSVQKTFDPILLDQPGALLLPDHVNAQEDYGLVEGDYVTVSGSAISGNNKTARIVRFEDLFEQPNRLIYLNTTFTSESPTTAVLAFRSQYDTYPVLCGATLDNDAVDVAGHVTLQDDFLHDAADTYQFFISASEPLKDFIATEVWLPVSAYSLTRRGRLSVSYTKPPIADERLLILNKTNVIQPENIKVSRGLNSRKYFNEIDWSYDVDDTGTFVSFIFYLDADSLNRIGVLSVLPITSRGAKTKLGANTLFEKRSNFLLSRYRFAAVQVDIKTNWEVGCQIEAGDIVAVQDNGNLQLTNLSTGIRDFGTQLFEVVNRSLDINQGMASLQLVAGIAYDITDRFATISPSSFLDTGSTTSFIIIKDSYGAIFPGDETRKWKDYFNLNVVIHDLNYTVSYTTTITRIDPINNYKMYVNPPLPVALPAGMVLDIEPYPDTPNKFDDSLYKVVHAFFSPRVMVVSGASNTQFDVGSGDVAKFFVGSHVLVHTPSYTVNSPEVKVLSITGTTINVDVDLGFTPDNTYEVTLIGFPDTGGAYRYI